MKIEGSASFGFFKAIFVLFCYLGPIDLVGSKNIYILF